MPSRPLKSTVVGLPSAGAAREARRRDPARTRARILAAAQEQFSSRGYALVGLRDIAAQAGIDVAMVSRYFGSKERLFEAALTEAIGTTDLWARPKADFGHAVVAMFVEEKDAALNPLRMFMQAATDPAAKAVALGLIRTRIVAPLSEWLGDPDGQARAGHILALCAGFFTYRVMLPLDQFSGALDPASRAWLEGALQDVVDGKAR